MALQAGCCLHGIPARGRLALARGWQASATAGRQRSVSTGAPSQPEWICTCGGRPAASRQLALAAHLVRGSQKGKVCLSSKGPASQGSDRS